MARRALIVEDDAPLRNGIREVLVQDGYVDSVATVGDLQDALTQTRQHQFDVILLGLVLNPADTRAAITQLRHASPISQVIVLGLQTDPTYKDAAIRNGAATYLLKDTLHDDLTTAIHVSA